MKIEFLAIFILLLFSCESLDCVELSVEDYKRNTKAEEAFEAGEIEKAISLTNESIEINPKNYIAYSNRGVFQYYACLEKVNISEKERNIIFSDFKISIDFCPNYGRAHRNLIRTHYKLQEYNDVIRLAKDYDKKFNNSSDILCLLGSFFSEKEQYDRAIKVLNKAETIQPVSKLLYIVRSKPQIKLGNYDEAIRDLNKAIERDSTNSFAFHERGYCFKKKEQFSLARIDYLQSLKIDSTKAEPYFYLGILEIEKGDTTEGCKYYQLALDRFIEEKALKKLEWFGENIEAEINRFCLKK